MKVKTYVHHYYDSEGNVLSTKDTVLTWKQYVKKNFENRKTYKYLSTKDTSKFYHL